MWKKASWCSRGDDGCWLEINMVEQKKEFITEVDYNKSSVACPTCSTECKKINDRINGRDLSKIKPKEVPHILKVFNF